jgi:hypothetical protein
MIAAGLFITGALNVLAKPDARVVLDEEYA